MPAYLVRHTPSGTGSEAPYGNRGVDSLVIKELMGHESLATTAIYVKVPVRQRIEAVESLPDLVCSTAFGGSR